jgi:hypothetical protein
MKKLFAPLVALLALAFAPLASAAMYGPFSWRDTAQPCTTSIDALGNAVQTCPQLAGAYAITDHATYQANLATLAPYAVTSPLPLQSALAGDDPASPKATVALHFPDFATALAVMAQVNGPVMPAPASLPTEVPMYKVKIVMRNTTSAHGGTLYDRVPTFIATLPADRQVVANELWAGAPNLVVNGDFAAAFKAWEGLSDAQWSALIAEAVGLAL